MFFKKSQNPEKDEAVVKRGIKKMDAVITGAILGGVVAGVYGVKKLRENQEEKNDENMENISAVMVSEKGEKKEKTGFFAKFFTSKK